MSFFTILQFGLSNKTHSAVSAARALIFIWLLESTSEIWKKRARVVKWMTLIIWEFHSSEKETASTWSVLWYSYYTASYNFLAYT